MTDSVRRAYSVLGLRPGAPPLLVRRQYRQLVGLWHKNRRAAEPANQAHAADNMREIDRAYRLLEEHAAAPGPQASSGTWDSSRNEQVVQAIVGSQQAFAPLSAGNVLSLLVAAAYLLAAAAGGDLGRVLVVLKYLVLPLACIWFGDEMGRHVGGRITRPTPGVIVRIGGWLLLLWPIVFAAGSALGGG